MERKPGSKPPGGNGEGGKGKEAGKTFTPHYLQPSPATVSVDASAFELLSRGASEEEARVLRRFLTEWSRGDEDTFPFQFALLARAQMRAAAGVPLEMAKVLQLHRDSTEDGARRIAQAADAKVAEFAEAGKLVAEMKKIVQGLTAESAAGLAQLKEVTAMYREAERKARAAINGSDWFLMTAALLVVAALGFLLGFVTYRYVYAVR